MTKVVAVVAAGLALIATLTSNPAFAADFPDMRGVWKATYLAVAPSSRTTTTPSFDKAEWHLEIKEQQENVFWGVSKWRIEGREEWNDVEATGSFDVNDPSKLIMVETAPNEPGAKGLIDGKLDGDKIYVTFKGIEFGVAFSTVLEKSSGN